MTDTQDAFYERSRHRTAVAGLVLLVGMIAAAIWAVCWAITEYQHDQSKERLACMEAGGKWSQIVETPHTMGCEL